MVARSYYQGLKARGGTQWNIFSSRGAPNWAIIGSYSLDLTFGCVVSLDTVVTKWPAREGVSIHSGCPGEWPPLGRGHNPAQKANLSSAPMDYCMVPDAVVVLYQPRICVGQYGSS